MQISVATGLVFELRVTNKLRPRVLDNFQVLFWALDVWEQQVENVFFELQFFDSFD